MPAFGPRSIFSKNNDASFDTLIAPMTNAPHIYCDPAIFAREQAELFAQQWLYAGLTHELAAHNDFVRVNLAGRDVIIQNLHGDLHAFINVCSHRHSIIHDTPCGNRPLTCPYHGWHYNAEGTPVGIPCKKAFPAVTANPQAFNLQKLEVAKAGDFVFVRMNPGDSDLPTFLGDAYDFLTKVSAGLDQCIDTHESHIQANWKIVIENSLEGYHVPLVHRSSLAKATEIQFSQENEDSLEFMPPTGHSSVNNKANKKWLERWSRYQNDIGQWPFMFEHYVHRLVFPNLTVTSFLGYSFHVQHFRPNGVDSTTVYSKIFSAKFDNQTPRGKIIMQSIMKENIHFTHLIFQEDKLACERTQQGSAQATRPSIPGEIIEQRVSDFRKTYARLQPLE